MKQFKVYNTLSMNLSNEFLEYENKLSELSDNEETEEDDEELIVKRKLIDLKPMDEQEAILQMELLILL